VTFAAGLATEGYKPFCAIYSTFLQRGYDQVVHDVAIQSLPVRLPSTAPAWSARRRDPCRLVRLRLSRLPAELRDHGGFRRSRNGAHGCKQVAINDRPSALRYPRGEGRGIEMPEVGIPLEIGKGRVVRQGSRSPCCRSAPVWRMRKAATNSPPRPVTTIADAAS